jgi:hypothetical protein
MPIQSVFVATNIIRLIRCSTKTRVTREDPQLCTTCGLTRVTPKTRTRTNENPNPGTRVRVFRWVQVGVELE